MSKVYIKTKFDKQLNMRIPHSHNIAQAMYGFNLLGKEVVPYDDINDIYEDIKFGDIVVDSVDNCLKVMNKYGVFSKLENYPELFKKFLGREIWTDTIDSIANDIAKYTAGWFVKPVKTKAFSGKMICGLNDLVGCRKPDEDFEVLCSDYVFIKAEWRCFMLNGDIIDIRPYNVTEDSWQYQYDVNTVKEMLKTFRKWEDAPVACGMDIAVIERLDGTQETILVEFNDAFALGSYGLSSVNYAMMLQSRWEQIFSLPD